MEASRPQSGRWVTHVRAGISTDRIPVGASKGSNMNANKGSNMKWNRFGALMAVGAVALVMTGMVARPAGAAVKSSAAVQPNKGPKPPKAPPGYTVVNSGTIDNPAGLQSRGNAVCPSGTVVLGGGGYSNSVATDVNLNSSFPNGSTEWSVDMNNAGSIDSSFVVYAVCANQPKKYSIEDGTSVDNPPGDQTTATVSCPAGTDLLGGGGYSNSIETSVNINMTLPNNEGWLVNMNNDSGSDAAEMAMAICGKEKAVTTAQGTTVGNPTDSQTGVTIACPGRTVPFGGGIFSSSPSLLVNDNSSEPISGGWESWENNASPDSDSINAWVVCGS